MKGQLAATTEASSRSLSGAPLLRVRPSAPSVAAAALVVAVTVVADPDGLAPYGPSKWAAATTGVLVLAALTGRARRLRVARLPTLLFAAVVGWSAVTAATGFDPLYAWIGTPERHWGVMAWVLSLIAFCGGQALRYRDDHLLAGAVCVAVGVAGLWAAAELAGWEPFGAVGGSGRPGGPFGSSAYLGAFTVLTLPLALSVAGDRCARARYRWTAGAVAVVGLLAFVGAGARAAWAGAGMATVAWAAVRRPSWGGRRGALLVAAGLAVVVVVAITGNAGRVPALMTDERGGARGRLDEWRVATRVVADHPLVGVGPEGYRIAFARAVDEGYEQAHGRSPLPDRAHSAVLDVAATLGTPGVVGYVALLAVVCASLVRGIRGRNPRVTGAAVGVLGYFAQSLFLFPVPELDVMAWLLAGVVVGATVRADEQRWLRVPAVVPAALGALAVAALVVGGLDVVADRASAGRGDPDRAARLRPDALRYRLVAARGHEAAGTLEGLDAALVRLDRARRLSPGDPVVQAEQGRLLLDRARRTGVRKDVERARAHLEGLVRRDPRNAEAHLRLGLARALDGDDAGAERAWIVAERLAPRSAAASTNLALAYARAGRTAEARAAAQRALQRDPQSARARDVLRSIDGT